MTKRLDCLVMEGVSDDCYWCAWVWALCWTVPRWPHAVLIGAVVLLTGCATQTWDGPGSAADFERDSYSCELETYRAPGPPAYASPASGATLTGLSQSLSNLSGAAMYRGAQDALYARCMRVRGYRRVD